ncbi:MAG: zinc ribbon domain-containing protein [Thermoplasmata archaeon]|nr:zinc ribbon domain-containing protein [Thermoplasmata archaeon]
MAQNGSSAKQLDEYRKELGKQYMDGLISDKEYEKLLHEREIELGLESKVAAKSEEEGLECPTCGALISGQDTECGICGAVLTPIMITADSGDLQPEEIPRAETDPQAVPENWKDEWLDKPFRNMTPEELLNQPPDALKGVSKGDSDRMKAAFNIRTLGDFANVKYIAWAQELTVLKEKPESFRKEDFRDKLVKKYEQKELDEILAAPTSALQGVSDTDSKKLAKAFNVKTVAELGNLKYAVWANKIHEMAQQSDGETQHLIRKIPENWREEWLDKPYRHMPPEELLKYPPYILKGVSKDDSIKMKDAFNVRTVEDFAIVKYLEWAEELVELKDSPQLFRKKDFKHKLIRQYENSSLEEILKAPTYALQGLSESDSKKLIKAFNTKTVEELGNLKYLKWANCIYDMAPPKVFKVGDTVRIPNGQIGVVTYTTEPDTKRLQKVEVAVV